MPSRLGPSLVLALALLAFLAFGASAWAEQRALDNGGPAIATVTFQGGNGELPALEPGAVFSTDASNSLGILLKGADLVRIFPNTTLTVIDVDLTASPLVLTLRLDSGSVWISDLQEVADLAVEAAHVRVSPEAASAWVSFANDQVEVFSAHHATRVSFLASDEPPSILNDYILTESHRVTLSSTPFDPALAQLRYTKLTKEYPFVYETEDQWKEEWTVALRSDLDRLRALETAFFSEVRRRGEAQTSTGHLARWFKPIYRAVRDGLTLEDQRRVSFEQSEALDQFYAALYDPSRLQGLSGVDLAPFAAVFHAVLPGNPSYAAKELLRQGRPSLASLRERLYEIYDLLDRGEPEQAAQALADYRAQWGALFDREGAALAPHVQTLTEERQILHYLLFQEDVFYTLADYETLAEFEDRIVHLTAAEFDLNEERQTFVQDKIRYVTRLVALVEERKVGAKAGSELGFKVIEDAEALLDDLTQKAAVTDYFSTLLASFKPKFAFIASADFSLGKGSFEERYAAYLKKQADLSDLASYIGRLGEGGGDGPNGFAGFAGSISREQALQEATADFAEAGVMVAALMPLDDPGHRLFTVQGGRVGLNAFSGNYDRASGLIYDLRVGDKAFSSGVRLDQLAATIRNVNQVPSEGEADGDSGTEEANGEANSALSPAAKLALDLAKQGFEGESDVELDPNSVTLLDLNQNLFQIQTSFTERKQTFDVSFSYDLDTHAVTFLTGTSQGIDFSLDSTVARGFVEAVTGAFEAQVASAAESAETAP